METQTSYHASTPEHAITRYLDHVDRRIRRIIRAKQKLIALLEEQKQAVIHQAVTGQIDVRTGRPHPVYKPSGVEWLGDVPEHWEVKRSKYLFREIDARSVSGAETRLSMSQKLGLIPSTEIEEKRLLSESPVGGKLCDKGDLVLNRLKAHLGVFALAEQRGIVSPD
jgi:type I restriction enzyme S subunit